MTLMFTQGHRVVGKVELVQLLCVKLHEAAQMFVMADYVREITGNTAFALLVMVIFCPENKLCI